jgi:hypothetical protein
MSVIWARCSRVLRSSLMGKSKRSCDFAQDDRKGGCPSSGRVDREFCGRRSWGKVRGPSTSLRMTGKEDVRHPGAVLQCFSFVGHGSASNLVRQESDARKFPRFEVRAEVAPKFRLDLCSRIRWDGSLLADGACWSQWRGVRALSRVGSP